MLTKKSCILFDLGGVLLNWDDSWAIDELSKRFRISKDKFREKFKVVAAADLTSVQAKAAIDFIQNMTSAPGPAAKPATKQAPAAAPKTDEDKIKAAEARESGQTAPSQGTSQKPKPGQAADHADDIPY